jgi:hypothetical protein
VLGPGEGIAMEPRHVQAVIESARVATRRFLLERGRRLFRESGVHYIRLAAATAD